MTVQDLLRQPYMSTAKVVAGKKGLGNPVSGITFLENADSINTQLKNSLVLTNELFFTLYGTQQMRQVIQTYSRIHTAAICFKLPSQHPNALLEELITAADLFQLPVLLLSPDTVISALISSLSFAILNQSGYNLSVSYEENLIQELIFAERDRQSILKRVAMLGVKADELLGLLLIQPRGAVSPQQIMEFCRQEWDASCLYSCKNRRLLVLIRMPQPYDTMLERLNRRAENLLAALRRRFPDGRIGIGIGHCYEDIPELKKTHYEAKIALIAGMMSSLERPIYLFDRMGVFRILFDLKNRDALFQFRDETVGVLRKYDEENGTAFLDTVRTFYERGNSVQETAHAMFVHYNTIRYRLSKLKELFGWDLLDRNDLTNLYVGLKVDAYLEEERNF